MAADIIKADNYKKEDLRFLLRRKYRNAGITKTDITTGTAGQQIIDAAQLGDFAYQSIWYERISPATNYYFLKKMSKISVEYTGAEIGGVIESGLSNGNMAIDKNGVITYIESGNDRVFYLAQSSKDIESNTATIIQTITDSGAGDGDLDNPQGCIYDNRGYLLIADANNNRIVKFGMGKYVNEKYIYSLSRIRCDIETEYFIACNNSGMGNGGVSRYDKNGGSIAGCEDYISLPNGCFSATNNFAVLTTGSIYSIDWTTGGTGGTLWKSGVSGVIVEYTYNSQSFLAVAGGAVAIYNITTGLLWREINIGVYFASDIQYSDGCLYISTVNKVLKYNIENNTTETIITTGTAILFIAVDGGGNVYCCEGPASEVLNKYGSNGNFHYQVSSSVSFGNMVGIDINYKTQRLYISDGSSSYVKWFEYHKWISNNTLGATLNTPTDIAADSDNNYYICDFTNDRVVKTNEDFVILKTLSLSKAAKIIYNPDSNNLYILPRETAYVYIYNTDLEYQTRMPIDTSVNIAGYYGNIAYVDKKILVMGDDGATSYDSEFFIYINNFDEMQIDITRWVSFRSDMTLSFDSDAANFSIGKIIPGDCSVELFNDEGLFNPEYESGSIFNDAGNNWQRNLSMIDIELKGNVIFKGIVDGKNATQKENFMVLKLFSPLKYLDTIPMTYFQQYIADADKISEIMAVMFNSAYTNEFFNYNAADISIYYDAVIDDVSELPTTFGNTLKLFAKIGLFSYGLYNGINFYTYNYIAAMQARTLDYIISENELLGVNAANKGEHRLFKTIHIKNDATEKEYTIPVNVLDIYNEDREIEITTKAITTEATQQAIVDNYEFLSVFPTKEFDIKLPLFMPSDSKLYNKQFAFNLFGNTRGYGFNIPALILGNLTIETKETALDELNSAARVLYYILGYKIKIGKEFIYEIKLREQIDDDYTP